MTVINGYILALDVGEARVGTAIASTVARIASPHSVILNNEDVWNNIENLLKTEGVSIVVVGLPRGLNGLDTAQTTYAREFAANLTNKFDLPVVLQDEALTSRQAEAELRNSGKKYSKGDIDALAATYILEDYLARPVNIDDMRGNNE